MQLPGVLALEKDAGLLCPEDPWAHRAPRCAHALGHGQAAEIRVSRHAFGCSPVSRQLRRLSLCQWQGRSRDLPRAARQCHGAGQGCQPAGIGDSQGRFIARYGAPSHASGEQDYADRLTDGEAAALATFLRTGWGNQASDVSESLVSKLPKHVQADAAPQRAL